jgi:hypothetical protein
MTEQKHDDVADGPDLMLRGDGTWAPADILADAPDGGVDELLTERGWLDERCSPRRTTRSSPTEFHRPSVVTRTRRLPLRERLTILCRHASAGWHAELEVRADDGTWRADVLASAHDGSRRIAWEAQLSPITAELLAAHR